MTDEPPHFYFYSQRCPCCSLGRQSSPAAAPGITELGDTRHRARAEGQGATFACTHPTCFPVCCSGCTQSCCWGVTPVTHSYAAVWAPALPAAALRRKRPGKRANRTSFWSGPSSSSPGQGMPERRNPVAVSRTPARASGKSTWNESQECPKLLLLPHHNITVFNKDHLCVCASLLNNITS